MRLPVHIDIVPFLKSQALSTGVRISEVYTVFKTIRVHICLFSIVFISKRRSFSNRATEGKLYVG